MINVVNKIILNAKNRFIEWTKIYKPWLGENHTTERNLSFQFATAFLEYYEQAQDKFAFMEVPFVVEEKNTEGDKKVKRRSNHLDAYLHAENIELLVESKNIYAPSHIPRIISDINRMNSVLISQIHQRHNTYPVKTFGIVLAETWYPHIDDWWKNHNNSGFTSTRKRWNTVQKLPTDWIFNSVKISDFASFTKPEETQPLYWLYGVSSQPL